MTHKELVRRMARWMKYSQNCSVVMSELAANNNSETPDVIGWKGGAHSILVECKTSRSDFYADREKFFRREEERGMGDVRYFAAPSGVLKPEDMPEGWGLLDVEDHCVRIRKEPTHKTANKKSECVIMMSALRRLKIATAVYVVAEETTAE